jgi:Leucine-rich repeat (LRR) protein
MKGRRGKSREKNFLNNILCFFWLIHLQPMKYQFLFILLVTVSCNRPSDHFEVDSEIVVERQLVSGTISYPDTTFVEFVFRDCFCNLANSGVVINHINRGTFVGESLTTHINNDSINFQLEMWSDAEPSPKHNIQSYRLTLNRRIFSLGETLKGQIHISGYRIDSDDKNQKVKFTVAGTFKCSLRDSTYTFDAYEADLKKSWIDEELKKLKRIAENNPDSVTELNLNGRFLKNIPKEIGKFSKLIKLNLNSNELSKIDVEFLRALPNLREIDLSRNGIKEIPEDISELKYLEVLNLSTNPISELPKSLYSMKLLKDLDLGATHIVVLSKEVRNLKNLTSLHIGYTDIRNIPLDLFALSKLERLHLPDSIVPFQLRGLNLKSLRELDVSFDFLQYNKSDLILLKNLTTLNVNFFYKTDAEQKDKSYDQEQFLKTLLPNVDVYVTTHVNPE